jgi:hypothetical protein
LLLLKGILSLLIMRTAPGKLRSSNAVLSLITALVSSEGYRLAAWFRPDVKSPQPSL